jgi:hypothetical protein
VNFLTPVELPADHYFFRPEAQLSGNFLWLSAAGPPNFAGDLQTWIRNAAAPVALEPGGAVEQEPHVDVVGSSAASTRRNRCNRVAAAML